MCDICIENPTISKVKVKHREFIKKALEKLSNAFTSQTEEWELRIYKDKLLKENKNSRFSKYMLLF